MTKSYFDFYTVRTLGRLVVIPPSVRAHPRARSDARTKWISGGVTGAVVCFFGTIKWGDWMRVTRPSFLAIFTTAIIWNYRDVSRGYVLHHLRQRFSSGASPPKGVPERTFAVIVAGIL